MGLKVDTHRETDFHSPGLAIIILHNSFKALIYNLKWLLEKKNWVLHNDTLKPILKKKNHHFFLPRIWLYITVKILTLCT